MSPRVLIVTMFHDEEPGTLGEASLWIEHRSLIQQVPIPGRAQGLFVDQKGDIALMVTGVGKTNAATSLMCVGMLPGIDLHDTYILVCGIAGANPNAVSVGSPVWCDAVVDGDLASFVSMEELDGARPYPFFPMGTTGAEDEEPYAAGTELYFLNKELVARALALTEGMDLVDDKQTAEYRSAYRDQPANRAPFVRRGGFLASDTFIHGQVTGAWSEAWFSQWTGNESEYVLGNQEDSGTLTALKALHRMGKVQWDRVLLLRAGSNYDRPAPGDSALQSLRRAIFNGVPVGMDIALHNIFSAANRFVDSVLD